MIAPIAFAEINRLRCVEVNAISPLPVATTVSLSLFGVPPAVVVDIQIRVKLRVRTLLGRKAMQIVDRAKMTKRVRL